MSEERNEVEPERELEREVEIDERDLLPPPENPHVFSAAFLIVLMLGMVVGWLADWRDRGLIVVGSPLIGVVIALALIGLRVIKLRRLRWFLLRMIPLGLIGVFELSVWWHFRR